ncbi:unnamed protein product [Rotaria socialis]
MNSIELSNIKPVNFRKNKTKQERWENRWSKMKGEFNDFELLCNLLRQHTRQCEHDLTSISILSPMNDVNRNLNELDQSFMYSQLLKDILLKIEYNTNAKQKLVGYCLELYQNNETELAVINEFQESCHLHTPI